MSVVGPNVLLAEPVVTHALADMSLATLALLLPVVAVMAVVQHTISLRRFGTAHVTRAQLETMRKHHPLLRKLSWLTTVLALLCGGLLIQLGYMATLSTAWAL